MVTAHYCDYYGVFLVVRFVEISGNFAKDDKSLLKKIYKNLLSLCFDVSKFQNCGNSK